jgi:hypothetical protein
MHHRARTNRPLESEFEKRNTMALARSIDPVEEPATDMNPIATSVSTEGAKQEFQNVEEFKPYRRYAAGGPHRDRTTGTEDSSRCSRIMRGVNVRPLIRTLVVGLPGFEPATS